MIASLAALATFGLFALFLLRRLTRSEISDSRLIEKLLNDEPILDRYRPMERLLRQSDWTYLSTQAGFTPARIRRIQAGRRAIFRRYLSCMTGDFDTMCHLVRALMVQSNEDRSDLSSMLTKIRFTYFMAILRIEFRLMAQAAGFSSIQMDISALTLVLDQMSEQARSLQLTSSPSLA